MMSKCNLFSDIDYSKEDRVFSFVTHSCGCCSNWSQKPHSVRPDMDAIYQLDELSDEETTEQMDIFVENLEIRLANAKEVRAIWLLSQQDKNNAN